MYSSLTLLTSSAKHWTFIIWFFHSKMSLRVRKTLIFTITDCKWQQRLGKWHMCLKTYIVFLSTIKNFLLSRYYRRPIILKPIVPGNDSRVSGHECRVTLPKAPLEWMGNIQFGEHLDKISSGPVSIVEVIHFYSVLTAKSSGHVYCKPPGRCFHIMI